jgi:hypothetical protein
MSPGMSPATPLPGSRSRRLGFRLLAACFVAGAVFHGACLVRPALDPTAPPWRHALFVGINLVVAVGLARRPRGFVPLFALLCLQQCYSHGGQAWRFWRDGRRIDAGSLVVLVVMPATLAALASDARERRLTGV